MRNTLPLVVGSTSGLMEFANRVHSTPSPDEDPFPFKRVLCSWRCFQPQTHQGGLPFGAEFERDTERLKSGSFTWQTAENYS